MIIYNFMQTTQHNSSQMAAATITSQALFFVESNTKWNPLLQTSFVRLPKTTNYKFSLKPSKHGIKCTFTDRHNSIYSTLSFCPGGTLFLSPLSSSSRPYAMGRMDYRLGLHSCAILSPFQSEAIANVFVGFLIFCSGFLIYCLARCSIDEAAAKAAAKAAANRRSVVKIQVGLLGRAKSLQVDLNRTAEAAHTSNRVGLHCVLTEAIVALLRHPSYWISACSSVDTVPCKLHAERRFQQLSIEERCKFDEETLANVNNIRKHTATAQSDSGFSNEYIVITILVIGQGVWALPDIICREDLEDALQKVAYSPRSIVERVEVLWTPQNENGSLSDRELIMDYPLLQPLMNVHNKNLQ